MSDFILVVDDEPKISKLARDYLERGGFRVETAVNGTTALAIARRDKPDLIVLDLNLPGMDGLDVCRQIRRDSDVPIIMLTARVDETDRLIGLELGADDYIVKPFSPRKLVARVRAVLRRATGNTHRSNRIRVRDVDIDLDSRLAYRNGRSLPLTRIEFNLLTIFVQHPGQAFSRSHLLSKLHGYTHDGYDRSVDAHIKNLRHKLEPDPGSPTYILTVYGIGYRFDDEENA